MSLPSLPGTWVLFRPGAARMDKWAVEIWIILKVLICDNHCPFYHTLRQARRLMAKTHTIK